MNSSTGAHPRVTRRHKIDHTGPVINRRRVITQRSITLTIVAAVLVLAYNVVTTRSMHATTAKTSVALASLPALRVESPDPRRPAYKRSDWQPHGWIDADGNGCNTRREVLITEATTKPSISPVGCHLSQGEWHPRFSTGTRVNDERELQIDHLVALADAERSGGWQWSQEKKIAFANNLDNPDELNALTSSMNDEKSDKGPDEWLPKNATDRCDYLRAYATIKAQWDLSVTPQQWRALVQHWPSCVT